MEIPKIIRSFGGVAGITMQPTGLDIGLDKSSITSIQKGATVSGSATIAISEVDLSRSIIVVEDPGNVRLDYLPLVSFASKSSLSTVKYDGAAVNLSTFKWTVIEFSKIKSRQSGIYSGTPASGTATISISAVDVNKSLAFCSFACNTVDNHSIGYWGSWCGTSLVIASSTSIQITPGGAYATKAAWFVVELL